MKKTREQDKFNSQKLCNYLKLNLHAPSIRKGGGGIFLKFLKKTVLPSPHTQFWSMFALLPPNINSPAPRNILFANIMVIFIFLRLSRFRLHIPPPFQKPRNVPDLYKSYFRRSLLSSRVMPCRFNPNQYIDPGLSECRSLWYRFLRYLHKTEA